MSQRAHLARQQQAARRRRSRMAVGVGAAVVAVALWLVLGSDDGSGDPSAEAVRVSMTEFAFDPDPIVLTAGDAARLDVVNDGAVAHDLLINELGKGTPDLAPGASMALDLSDQPAGTYQVICDLPGHAEAGMVTELTIE